MLIDWFTVIAQVINFLILVWLLKRFLYRPILNAIDTREKNIAAKISSAEAKEAEAHQQQKEYQQKNRQFEQQRDAHMNEAVEAAKAKRAQLLDAVRQEADDLRRRQQQAIQNEQLSVNEELKRRLREEVFAIARKTLSDLAGANLELRISEIFLERLRELDHATISELKSLLAPSANALQIRSAFQLSTQQKADIEAVLTDVLGKHNPPEFSVVTDLISGIELSAGGRKIAWSISDYLDSMAKSVDDLLNKNSVKDAMSKKQP